MVAAGPIEEVPEALCDELLQPPVVQDQGGDGLTRVPCPAASSGDCGLEAQAEKRRRKGAREFDWTKATFAHFVLKISYVGTKYHGLAWQDPATTPNCPTIEGKLFEALVKTCLIRDRASCGYSRCGRTDRGVHAAGNYVALQLRLKPPRRAEGEEAEEDYDYAAILNGVLPQDIRVLAGARAPPGFDARFSCLYRAYQYYFPLGDEDLDRMREAAQHFVGEHDFQNYCKMDIENVTNYRRRVLSVSVEARSGGVGEFAVTGVAFLWHQVRCMVAVLLMVGLGFEEPGLVAQLLDVERHPRKPIYEPADESGLVLRDCGFEGLPFASGWPPPPAGSASATATATSAPSAAETLRQMHSQALRAAAVHGCLAEAASAGGTGTAEAGRARRQHIPLLRRAVCPSLEEKASALEAKRRRKGCEEDVAAAEQADE